MKACITFVLLVSGCGVPLFSYNRVHVDGKAETESEVEVRVSTDARETCEPLLPDRKAYQSCVEDYMESVACVYSVGKNDVKCRDQK